MERYTEKPKKVATSKPEKSGTKANKGHRKGELNWETAHSRPWASHSQCSLRQTITRTTERLTENNDDSGDTKKRK